MTRRNVLGAAMRSDWSDHVVDDGALRSLCGHRVPGPAMKGWVAGSNAASLHRRGT